MTAILVRIGVEIPSSDVRARQLGDYAVSDLIFQGNRRNSLEIRGQWQGGQDGSRFAGYGSRSSAGKLHTARVDGKYFKIARIL
ncbi:hypothetical protein HZH66_005454 [Vespula vulgaris]|uniref:Uncharacterized protein n=1 Tax=Vespula vulgaris TaxID=7454 RepID=A0A834K5H6_VESVU|nr:hypothetical protein HZH66_005454 [Vespula vulgaris]